MSVYQGASSDLILLAEDEARMLGQPTLEVTSRPIYLTSVIHRLR